MWGADDPDCRKPMVWKEFDYDDENAESVTGKSERFKVSFNETVFSDYQSLISLHQRSAALKYGSFKFLFADDEKNLVAFERAHQNDIVKIILNRSSQTQSIMISSEKNLVDMLSERVFISENGRVSLLLEGASGVFLK
jgi:glycosidase